MAPKSLALMLALAALAPLGCGGTEERTTSSVPGGADLDDVVVIDEWSRTLRNGDIEGAAALFAIPSVAQNGPTVRIDDLTDAVTFNASLPCGAVLIEAVPDGELTVATFELTERPGPGACGFGTGATARTAFLIEGGKIVEWRRVAGDAVEPEPEGPIV